ncbi:gamma-butyrobetaine hydroxylase-like domain-containing protein [Candidatus Palauibacter sp.]|uniref:gamma-butyrobetaine hydroxylase-like domain-containing protein n=1 Tax=Candidatus Palauibacter sp. TaxID=3101350 RepID=UPI003B525D70
MHHSISSLARNADALTAVWSGGERTDLPYLWLRDNCGCGECCVEQTTEKRFHIFHVPSDLRPSTSRVPAPRTRRSPSPGRTDTAPATGRARSTPS